MTQEQALVPFEGLESFKGYSKEEKINYVKTLLNIDENLLTGKEFINDCDMEGSLEILAHVRWYQELLELIYKYGSRLVLAYVMANKTVKTLDGSFSTMTKNVYDFSVNENWQYFDNEIVAITEGKKQLEEVLKKGGMFAGETIEAIKPEPQISLRFSIEK